MMIGELSLLTDTMKEIVELKDAEIAKLRADVAEAKEIIRAFLKDYPEDEERDIQRRFADAMDVRDASTIDVVSPKVRRARAFLDRTKG